VLENRERFAGRIILLLTACVLILTVAESVFSQESQEKTDFSYGERLFNEGFYDLAMIQFQDFVDHYPASPLAAQAQFFVGQSAFESEKFDIAQKAYMDLILRYPASSWVDHAQLRIGDCFQKMGMMDEAAESYLRVFNAYPKSSWAMEGLYRSSTLSMEQGHFLKAESVASLLLDNATGEYRSKAILLLSDIYVLQEAYEKAISVLQPLLEHPIQESDNIEIRYRLGRIREQLGHWGESISQYRQVISLPGADDVRQKAAYNLGWLLTIQDEGIQAVNAFGEAIKIGSDEHIRNQAMYHLGLIHAGQNAYPSALEMFNKIDNARSESRLRWPARYEKAKCLDALKRSDEAAALYESILQEVSASPVVVKKSFLTLAQRCIQDQTYQRALQLYDKYLRLFPDDPLVDAVLLQEGKLYIDPLSLWVEGFAVLRRVWTDWPESPRIPEARFVYAEGLEKLDRFQEAVQMYRTIRDGYPTSSWARRAEDKIERLVPLQGVDMKQGLSRFSEVVQTMLLRPNDADLLWTMGKLSLENLGQFEDAVALFTRFLSEEASRGRRDEVLYHLAKSYEALYLRDQDNSQLERAMNACRSLISEYPESAWSDDAHIFLVQWETASSPQLTYRRYLDISKQYPKSEKLDEILYRLGMTAVEADSLPLALVVLQEHHQRFPESPFDEEIVYRMGKIRFDQGNDSEADSILQYVSERFPQGRFMPQVLFYRAQIAQNRNDTKRAAALLENLRQRFSYSPWAQQGIPLLGKCHILNRDYARAVALFRYALESDSLHQWSASVGLSVPKESRRKDYLWGLAQAYQGLKDYKKAKQAYFDYLREGASPQDRVRVFYALSALAEEEGRISRAEDYLSRLVKETASDTTAEALGHLRFRLEQYSAAVEAFDRALGLTQTDEHRASLSARIIVCQLRENQIPQAEVRINVFNQSYSRTPDFRQHQAEFLLEKGKAYVRRKDFDLALQSVQEVVQRYGNTQFRMEAELEMGRIYLVTNRIEEALNILTEMPRRYPQHPMLAHVYLNLGDHYYRSQQYENALHAFKRTVELGRETDSDATPLGMRYLIRVYDSLRMYDAALHLTRDYIQRYPDAEDILQKRVQIGLFYMKLNEYGRAIEVFRDVKKAADYETEAEIQYWIGSCFSSMGQFQQAVFEFMRVAYLSKPTKLPWATTALYEAGQAYLKLEQPDQAKKLFEQIVRREGGASDMGRIARERIEEIKALKEGKESR